VANQTFIALAPEELPRAQAEVIAWCRRKIVQLG
jgi:hypothetical protein